VRIVTPAAVPGLLTAVLLAMSRAVGETAPLIWVIGNNYVATWSPYKQQSAIPIAIYNGLLNAGSPLQQDYAWGSALFLVVVVLFLNLGSRLLAAFLRRERH
jgi:ABC-type phosphate transport system permease subunit